MAHLLEHGAIVVHQRKDHAITGRNEPSLDLAAKRLILTALIS
jgi:hypothetical protein